MRCLYFLLPQLWPVTSNAHAHRAFLVWIFGQRLWGKNTGPTWLTLLAEFPRPCPSFAAGGRGHCLHWPLTPFVIFPVWKIRTFITCVSCGLRSDPENAVYWPCFWCPAECFFCVHLLYSLRGVEWLSHCWCLTSSSPLNHSERSKFKASTLHNPPPHPSN